MVCVKINTVIIILCVVLEYLGLVQPEKIKFPKGFKFGVATASYQIEGGWNASGKGENIWDRITHVQPNWIIDGTNGDIACDSYNKLSSDLDNLQWLGVDFYRFSLSWSRILPSGYVNKINPDGVRYYNELIDGLLQRNITPMVTLYHWDLPQPLQEFGGWPNEELVNFYEDYARIVFSLFGDRVKNWITFNEPIQVCSMGYGSGDLAPGYNSSGIGEYQCGRTLILAHARAYHLYERKFKSTQKGKVGITISAGWYQQATNSPADVEAAERAIQMRFGWWAHPIYSKEGDYPDVFKNRIEKNSKEERFPRSRLKPFTPEEVQYIRGTSDFFGLNHYTSMMVQAVKDAKKMNWKTPSLRKDMGVKFYYDPSWAGSAAPWLKVVPWGFRKLLKWIKDQYDDPEIIITENGYADYGQLNDTERINYYQEYLKSMLKAIHLDGCKVRGYTAWSLMDNFEWRDGYTQRFGLFYVDVTSSNRTRTPKESARVYKSIIKSRAVYIAEPAVKITN